MDPVIPNLSADVLVPLTPSAREIVLRTCQVINMLCDKQWTAFVSTKMLLTGERKKRELANIDEHALENALMFLSGLGLLYAIPVKFKEHGRIQEYRFFFSEHCNWRYVPGMYLVDRIQGGLLRLNYQIQDGKLICQRYFNGKGVVPGLIERNSSQVSPTFNDPHLFYFGPDTEEPPFDGVMKPQRCATPQMSEAEEIDPFQVMQLE